MRTVIVGGGITGLSAAYELEKRGLECTLVERSAKLGGVIRTERVEGNVLECGPDSFISQKPAALELIREVGLDGDVIGSNDDRRVTYIWKNGRLVALPDGMMMMVPTKIMPMALSPLLSWGTKIRMGLELFRKPPATPGGDRTVSEFILDHYGQETLDYLAEPLLSGVYGGDPGQLSVNSVLPRFIDLETKYGSLTKGVLAQKAKAPSPPPNSAPSSLFRTLRNGLDTLVSKIAPKSVLLNTQVEALERNPSGSGYRVRVNGDWMEASNVVVTGPAYVAGGLLGGLDPTLGATLNQVDYSSSVTVNLGYKKSTLPRELVGFGLLVPKVENRRMRACTFVANKFSYRVADGWQVIRCFFGGAGDAAVLGESDESIRRLAVEELRAITGISAEPDFCSVTRWSRSMAQYPVGHSKRYESIRAAVAKLPGIHLAGNGYIGIGIPDCVQMGRAAGKSIAESQAPIA